MEGSNSFTNCKTDPDTDSIISIGSSNSAVNIGKKLIGGEYVIKLVSQNKVPIKYVCVICDVQDNANKIEEHMLGHSHRKTVLKRHFPTALNQFTQFNYQKEVMDRIYDKLCTAIVLYHGKQIPFEYEYGKFLRNKPKICAKIFSQYHASELNGPSFIDAVTGDEIDMFVKNNNMTKKNREKNVRKTFDINATNQNSIYTSPLLATADSPQTANTSDNSQRYESLLKRSMKSLDLEYKGFFENIKTHPSHDSEMSKFLFQKEKKLKNHGIDYYREWVECFKKFITELYDLDVKELKENLKRSLGLPIIEENPPNEVITDETDPIALFRRIIAIEEEMRNLGPLILQLLTDIFSQEERMRYNATNIFLTSHGAQLLQISKFKLREAISGRPTGQFEEEREMLNVDESPNDRSEIATQSLRTSYNNIENIQQMGNAIYSINMEEEPNAYHPARPQYWSLAPHIVSSTMTRSQHIATQHILNSHTVQQNVNVNSQNLSNQQFIQQPMWAPNLQHQRQANFFDTDENSTQQHLITEQNWMQNYMQQQQTNCFRILNNNGNQLNDETYSNSRSLMQQESRLSDLSYNRNLCLGNINNHLGRINTNIKNTTEHSNNSSRNKIANLTKRQLWWRRNRFKNNKSAGNEQNNNHQ